MCVIDYDEEVFSCIICLERVFCCGKLSVCNYWFCFFCILEWVEVKIIYLVMYFVVLLCIFIIGFVEKWK